MGKTRNKKKRGNKPNPTGLPSVKDILAEEESLGEGSNSLSQSLEFSQLESRIQNITDQLQSASVEERECGCSSLALLVSQKEAAEAVLKNGLVKVAGPLLVDQSHFVRHTAAGALRNLSVAGGHAFCDVMVEQDIMTPLTALLKQHFCNWHPSKTATERKKIDTKKEVFLQVVHLLWNLCESNSTAVSLFNKAEILPIVARCLDVDVFDMETVIAVAQCLNTVSENNPEVITKLTQSEDMLRKLLGLPEDDAATLLLRTLTAGIILNLKFGMIASLPSPIMAEIMTTLSATLEVDHNTILSKYLVKELHIPGTSVPIDSTVIQKDLEELDYLLAAQQTALEILTNICCNDDGEEGEEQDSSSSSSDEVVACFVDEDEMMDSDSSPLGLSSELHEAILSHQLVRKTLDKAKYVEQNADGVFRETDEGQKVYRKISALRCRAFLCLHNLVSNLDIEDLGGPQQLYDMWCNLGMLTFKETAAADMELLEAATSLMRAILQKLAETKYTHFEQLTVEDLQLMFNGAHQCTDANVRANLVRITGTLGVLLGNSKAENATNLLKLIGNFHLEMCSKDPELWVVAETLDAIFDVFGEDHMDKIVEEIGLVEKLRNLLPTVKHKVNLQRKTLGDHYPIVMTAKTNLIRFIKYKSCRPGAVSEANGHLE